MQRIIVTKSPKPQNIKNLWDNNESDGPLMGGTGTLVHWMQHKAVIEWDNDNPICRGYEKTVGLEKTFVKTENYDTITENEFQKRKLVNQNYGLKKYIKNVFNIDIRHTNMRIISGLSPEVPTINFTKSDTGHTIFLGCRFHDITFLRTDLDSSYFINCLFTGIIRRMEMNPFRNHNFINCEGLPQDINEIPEMS